jgi:hypothetical protein
MNVGNEELVERTDETLGISTNIHFRARIVRHCSFKDFLVYSIKRCFPAYSISEELLEVEKVILLLHFVMPPSKRLNEYGR